VTAALFAGDGQEEHFMFGFQTEFIEKIGDVQARERCKAAG